MANYLLKEDGDYLLKEDGDKIILQLGSSPSLSPSASFSPSPSATPSHSPSLSPSTSISLSDSPSPSEGYQRYSRGNLPNAGRYLYGGVGGVRYLYGEHIRYGGERGVDVDDSDLGTIYTEDEKIDVAQTDAVRVGQLGILEFMIHQYKDFVNAEGYCTIEWFGRSKLEGYRSTIYLQVYNQVTNEWETLDSNNTAEEYEDVELFATLLDLTNYKTAINTISCRVYQRAIL